MEKRYDPLLALLLLLQQPALPPVAEVDVPTLVGFASLPAETFVPGPTSGQFIGAANGVAPPFAGRQPVQGFSSILRVADGEFLALVDNGFGAKANSPDHLLRAYRLRVSPRTRSGGAGSITVLSPITLRDPNRRVPFPLVADAAVYPGGRGGIPVDPAVVSGRLLTGSDFDVESFRAASDGSLWFGDEFGPFLLHTDAAGVLIDAPFSLEGARSPQHPLPGTPTLAASRGFEGMGQSADGRYLYPMLEGTITGAPAGRLRINEFDTATKAFTARQWIYPLDDPANSIGDLTPVTERIFVVIERDDRQGAEARFKKVFAVNLDALDAQGGLIKREVVDLLNIADPDRLGGTDAVFRFPFQTIESQVPISDRELALVNDNNFPFSAARRPGAPDPSEFIVIRLPRAIRDYAPTPQGGPAAASEPAVVLEHARPFGTLREQAALQEAWLKSRLDTVLPPLLRKHGIDMWVVPMREYNEDPVFTALTSPETFAARRRTIYVFFDRCAVTGAPTNAACLERLALGGTTQGGLYDARSSSLPTSQPGRQAELWGDEQWQLLKQVIEERAPRAIGINRSRTFAFADGLSSGELAGMSEAIGPAWMTKVKDAEGLPVDLIATRLPDEEAFFSKMNELVWGLTQEMFSARVITAGTTRTSDLVWWWRERVNKLGLETWFQPSITVQRRGATPATLGADPVILPGDVLHCDVGLTAARLNTDTQHNAYVLRPGEAAPPAGLVKALANANAMQDIAMSEIRPGRTGNEILAAVLAATKARDISGTMYSHPIGLHGHGAGATIGLWDRQDGVPGRGDIQVIPSMWFSIELQATTPVAEWDGQAVRIAQEEDMIIDARGIARWAVRRQDRFFLVGVPR